MKRILGMGSALVDILIRLGDDSPLEQLALPRGSMQLVDRERRDAVLAFFNNYQKSMAAGGSAANTVHGIGKLGGKAGFIGMIGEDELGRSFALDMENAGVAVTLFRSNTPTGCAISLISPDSERTFATYLGAASELELNGGRLPIAIGTADGGARTVKEVFGDYDILHLEGYLVFNQPLTESAIKLAKEAGLQVSLDLASYNVVEANIDFLRRIIREHVDIVFANEEEAKAFTDKSPGEALDEIAGMAEYAIVKIGARGSLIRHGDERATIGAIPVKPVDTTGAGDLYASGFLYGLAKGMPLQSCGELGALLAGKVIEVIGPKMTEAAWEVIRKKVTE
jgi:sugar/nucleoside kinase (ribokinase family)